MYKIRLELNNKVQKVEHETLIGAMKLLKKPVVIKTMGLINISEGKRKYEKVMNIPRLKSLFNETNDVYKIVMAKNFQLFLK